MYIKQTVLYEFSDNLIASDDMILRENAFVLCGSNRVGYKKGIVYIDDFMTSGKLKVVCSLKLDQINIKSDSIHSILRGSNTKEIKTKGGYIYKKYKIELVSVFLGNSSLLYIKNRKIKEIIAPCYQLIRLNKIEAL